MSWDILPKANLQYFLSKLKEKFDLKVDKVSGKGLSTNDYTTSEKNKLSGIAAGAEVNVQSDWDASSGDAFIKNKPDVLKVTQNKLEVADSWRRVLLSETNNDTNNSGYTYKINSIIFQNKVIGTASNDGRSILRIGNTTVSGDPGNQYGELQICGKNDKVVSLITDNLTSSRFQTLQDATGTIALTNDIFNAIGLLDGVISGSANEAKTLTAFSQSDGIVSATFGNIKIDESQVTNLTTDLSKKAVNLELTNEDLNTVKETGFYIGKSGNTCTNKPSGVSQFGLIVIKTATSNSFSWEQICFKPSGVIYQRNDQKISNVETWSAWEEIKTTDTDTTYTFAEGSSNGTFNVTPSGGSPQSVAIHGLGDRAYDSTAYLPLTGGTLTGTLTIKREYSEGDSEVYPRISLQTGYTPTGGSKITNTSYLDAHSPLSGTGGNNLVITPKGNIFIGGGEAPQNHYDLYAGRTGEVTYITGDNVVHIQANGGTIANRKGLQISNSHTIVPDVADNPTNNVGSIGSSNYRWANGYFTTINVGTEVFPQGNYTVTLTAGTLVEDRELQLPNINGVLVASSVNYGNSYTAKSGENWSSAFISFRSLYLTDYASRRSVIRVSSMDGNTQLIFQCMRWRNKDEQTWTCTFCDPLSGLVTYSFVSKGETSVSVLKLVSTSSGTDLSNVNANGATLYVN